MLYTQHGSLHFMHNFLSSIKWSKNTKAEFASHFLLVVRMWSLNKRGKGNCINWIILSWWWVVHPAIQAQITKLLATYCLSQVFFFCIATVCLYFISTHRHMWCIQVNWAKLALDLEYYFYVQAWTCVVWLILEVKSWYGLLGMIDRLALCISKLNRMVGHKC